MSVLIKGMKMPKSCAECWFYDTCSEYETDYDNGDFAVFRQWSKCTLPNTNGRVPKSEYYTKTEKERMPDCPLVDVPPHCRLIDEKKMLQYWEKFIGYETPVSTLCEFIKDAPVIIESEEE